VCSLNITNAVEKSSFSEVGTSSGIVRKNSYGPVKQKESRRIRRDMEIRYRIFFTRGRFCKIHEIAQIKMVLTY
jgi:hypothetical protein